MNNQAAVSGWLIINERTSYQFPLSYRMAGYSDLAVLFLPPAKASGCGEYLAALKAIAVHFGNTEEGKQAQKSLLFEPGRSKVGKQAVGFDAVSFAQSDRGRKRPNRDLQPII